MLGQGDNKYCSKALFGLSSSVNVIEVLGRLYAKVSRSVVGRISQMYVGDGADGTKSDGNTKRTGEQKNVRTLFDTAMVFPHSRPALASEI